MRVCIHVRIGGVWLSRKQHLIFDFLNALKRRFVRLMIKVNPIIIKICVSQTRKKGKINWFSIVPVDKWDFLTFTPRDECFWSLWSRRYFPYVLSSSAWTVFFVTVTFWSVAVDKKKIEISLFLSCSVALSVSSPFENVKCWFQK